MILKESYSGSVLVPEECEFFERRVISVCGQVTAEMADRFAMQLALLSEEEGDITVLVSSPGGDVQAGLSICDAMAEAGSRVSSLCLQRAYSMGAVIFSSAPGNRIMAPHAKIMFHEPLVSGLPDGRLSSVKEIATSLDACKEDLCKLVSQRSGIAMRKVRDICSSDHYYGADEAIKMGLADKVGGILSVARKESL